MPENLHMRVCWCVCVCLCIYTRLIHVESITPISSINQLSESTNPLI